MRSRDCDDTIFERLSHHFEDVALEFWKFVQKNDAVMAERDFARARVDVSTDEPGGADGVVR